MCTDFCLPCIGSKIQFYGYAASRILRNLELVELTVYKSAITDIEMVELTVYKSAITEIEIVELAVYTRAQ